MRLNGTGDAIEECEYPTTTATLIEECGHYTIDLHGESESLGAVFERIEDETYDDPQEVREVIFSAVSGRAVGRRGYSDRDLVTPGEDGPTPVSF